MGVVRNRKELQRVISKQQTIYLKAIAIIMVIGTHILGSICGITNLYGKYGFPDRYLNNLLGTGGVCLFLVLSGYGTYMSYVENGLCRSFWDKKVRNIYFPYWCATLIWCIILKKNISMIIIVKNLLCVDYERSLDGTMWYMSLLILFYLLFFVIFQIKISDQIKIILLLIGSLCIREYALSGVFKGCNWQFHNNYLSFWIGVCWAWGVKKLEKYGRDLKKGEKRIIVGISYMMYIYGCMKIFSFQVLGILFSLGTIFFITVLNCSEDREFKSWRWIGVNSYTLYLLEGKLMDVYKMVNISNLVILVVCYILTLWMLTLMFSGLMKVMKKNCFDV